MFPDQSKSAPSTTVVPRIASLEGFAEAIQSNNGIGIKDIPIGTVLEIVVEDSVFTFLVDDPNNKKVKVRGKFLPTLTECRFLGSSFYGGCNLKTGWIGVGMCINLFTPNQEPGTTFVTAPVKTISIVTAGTSLIQ